MGHASAEPHRRNSRIFAAGGDCYGGGALVLRRPMGAYDGPCCTVHDGSIATFPRFHGRLAVSAHPWGRGARGGISQYQ